MYQSMMAIECATTHFKYCVINAIYQITQMQIITCYTAWYQYQLTVQLTVGKISVILSMAQIATWIPKFTVVYQVIPRLI